MFRRSWADVAQAWYDDRYYWTLWSETGLSDLDLDSRSQGCEEAKVSALIIPQNSQSIWVEFDQTFWLMKLKHILSLRLIFQRENPPMWFRFKQINKQTNKHFNVDLCSNIYRPICFETVWRQTELHSTFWYQFEWPWLLFKGTVVNEIEISAPIFSVNFSTDLNEI